jgi:hypothetical protein
MNTHRRIKETAQDSDLSRRSKTNEKQKNSKQTMFRSRSGVQDATVLFAPLQPQFTGLVDGRSVIPNVYTDNAKNSAAHKQKPNI